MSEGEDTRNKFIELGTTTHGPKNLVKLLILQSKYNLDESLERYNIKKGQGVQTDAHISVVKARLTTLYYWLKNTIAKEKKQDYIDTLLNQIKSNDIKEVLKAVEDVYTFLYDLNLTKIDTDAYDKTLTDVEDNVKGL